MNRGILFSMDAVLALIVVIMFAAWLPHYFSVAGENAPFEALHDQARDRAIVGLYLERPEDLGISTDASFAKCVSVYTIEPNNTLGIRDLETKSFCEEIG